MTVAALPTDAGWPFLVARGYHVDHRTLLAPDFLVDSRQYGAISDAVSQRDARPGEVCSVELSTRDGVLRAHYATEVLDDDGTGQHLDEHGRPFSITYGVVTAQRPDEHTMQRAREQALATYARFLAQEDGFAVVASRSLALHPESPVGPRYGPEPMTDPPLKPDPSRPRWLLAGGATALVVAVAAAAVLVLSSSSSSPPGLTVAAQAVSCTAPVTLTARVTSTAARTVSYRWVTSAGIELARGGLAFAAAGSRPVAIAGAANGTVALRLSAPGVVRELSFDVRC